MKKNNMNQTDIEKFDEVEELTADEISDTIGGGIPQVAFPSINNKMAKSTADISVVKQKISNTQQQKMKYT